ncbi:MAG: RNase adapter RapZ [Gammaproteobacteria bacterium]|nr:RNase adapter RapZ [Gammaproteobacteria bacterium]MCY4218839.1 RNase adapter RapZ [Gammaproteobacteria bacterium]MCY4275874.1 RNase adapter RapZ [Gammaproteobacteria bacterium]
MAISELIIISGLSGSGKSVALQSLEDVGYYCIDNLPVGLLHELMVKLLQDNKNGKLEVHGIAVSIDSRNKQFLLEIDEALNNLNKLGIEFRVLYLESEDHILVRRYSETRRKHPLTDQFTPLLEGIQQERNLLMPILDRAERVIDTTTVTPHELRSSVKDFAAGDTIHGPLLLIESFSFRHGPPNDADFMFDVRCLPNPYWQESLRSLNGLDKPVQEFLEQQAEVNQMIRQIQQFLTTWLPGFVRENRCYITVAIGCTGGQHRSVFISDKLHKLLSSESLPVQIRHRDLCVKTGIHAS